MHSECVEQYYWDEVDFFKAYILQADYKEANLEEVAKEQTYLKK